MGYIAQYPVFRGRLHQKGRGLGGLFRGLLKKAVPILKKGFAHAGKRALTVGANAIADSSNNNISLKDAFKKQAKSEIKNVVSNVINRSKKRKKTVSTSKKRKGTTAKRRKIVL